MLIIIRCSGINYIFLPRITTELSIDLDLLLLDEPTTGLDSFTAHYLVVTLAELAQKRNKIILMSIHQPRSDIFSLFDQIGILSQGQVVYFGPREELVPYFSSLGYPCPTYANPLDHYGGLSSQAAQLIIHLFLLMLVYPNVD